MAKLVHTVIRRHEVYPAIGLVALTHRYYSKFPKTNYFENPADEKPNRGCDHTKYGSGEKI